MLRDLRYDYGILTLHNLYPIKTDIFYNDYERYILLLKIISSFIKNES